MDQIIKGTLKIPVCNPRLLLTITWFSYINVLKQVKSMYICIQLLLESCTSFP